MEAEGALILISLKVVALKGTALKDVHHFSVMPPAAQAAAEKRLPWKGTASAVPH
jgi:hypothetical protein